MMRHAVALALPTALAVTLAAGPVPSARAQASGAGARPVEEQLQQLDDSLKEAFGKVGEEVKALRHDLKGVREGRADLREKLEDALARVTALDRAMTEMKRELQSLARRPGGEAAGQPDRFALDDVQRRLARIEGLLDRPAVPARVALYPPDAEEAPGPRGTKARKVRGELGRLDAAARRGFDRLREELAALRQEVRECRDDRTDARLRYQTTLSTLGALQPQIAEVKGELEALRLRPPEAVSLYPPAGRADLADIRARLDDIDRRLARTPRPARVALYPSAATGRVVLVNTYPQELTFVVDGRSYRVAPGASMDLEGQPAGTLTYEIISPTWGVRDRRTTALASGETLTLTAR